MSKVSVIIPCFNASAYIVRCLKALENQTYKDFDVIIVDDCSTDDTGKVVADYRKISKMDIILVRNAKNSGPAAARRKGIELSDSEYVTFCDSDDWYEKVFLMEMLEALEKNRADIVFCGHNVVHLSGSIEARQMQGRAIIDDKSEALALKADSLCMLMVKRTVILNCPWLDIRNGEDMAMIPLLICSSERCCVLQQCLYNYFVRYSSASNTLSEKVVDALEASFLFIQSHMPKQYALQTEYIGINNWLYAGLITLFSISYDVERGRYIVDEFESVYPMWSQNPLQRNLESYKRLVLFMAQKRIFWGIRVIALIRRILKRGR